MILDEIVLENFGAYAGRQSVVLTPKSEERRITIVGALNGRGKTTMLDGIQLALYGNRAKVSNRGSNSYDTYLRRARHRGSAKSDPFAVELAFSINDTKGKMSYQIRRSFVETASNVKEVLEVHRDGQRDRALTETWSEYIEELLPLEISSLFFFDGEKIAELADPVQASHVISAAVTGLLGLGVIERLQRDLLVVERRKQDEVIPIGDSAHIEELAEAVTRTDDAARIAAQRCAEERNQIDRKEQLLREAEEEAQREGGSLFERRLELERKRAAAQTEVAMIDVNLRGLAAGTLPLALCQGLVDSLATSSASGAALEANLVTLLERRDEELVKRALQEGIDPEAVKLVAEVMDRDRQRRFVESVSQSYHPAALAVRAANSAASQVSIDLSSTRAFLADRVASRELVADSERQLAGVPNADVIEGILEKRNQLRAELAAANVRLDLLVQTLEDAERSLELREAEYERERQLLAMSRVRGQDAGRTMEHAAKVRATLDLLKFEVRQRNIRSIETAVVTCFRELLGKQNFVAALTLDPSTCEPVLTNFEGRELHMERLSAGERQLFAISMLWGLAMVSGRQLPTIIDTPLGRLDSEHRQILVERYFPNAADQVILLSTDEEIDERLAQRLSETAGRWYRIDYDDEAGVSTVSEGYLFEGVGDGT